MTTNLTTENVAGFGAIVYFRFQTAVLVWACVGVALHLFFGMSLASDIFILGLRKAVEHIWGAC